MWKNRIKLYKMNNTKSVSNRSNKIVDITSITCQCCNQNTSFMICIFCNRLMCPLCIEDNDTCLICFHDDNLSDILQSYHNSIKTGKSFIVKIKNGKKHIIVKNILGCFYV